MELRGPNVQDQVMPSLDGLHYLKSLTFNRTRISDPWVQAYRESHPECVVTLVGGIQSNQMPVNISATALTQ